MGKIPQERAKTPKNRKSQKDSKRARQNEENTKKYWCWIFISSILVETIG
jgi:hypothetical protein